VSRQDRRVVIITGGSQGIGSGLVAAYGRLDQAVVDSSHTIEPTAVRDLLTIRRGAEATPAVSSAVLSMSL
jgi:NAD(P)-dependent dehydrogenase (short-subunit alcohol dehydrogenase family)